MQIFYREGFKYQLARDFFIQLPAELKREEPVELPFIYLSEDGHLRVKTGYAWDGPSGLTKDTKTFMRPSLVHDVLYQLIRNGYLEHTARATADDLLRQLCLEDGMSKFRAWYVYRAVKRFAGFAASASNQKKVLVAPVFE